MDGQPDRRSADELNPIGCYFHPDRPSRYRCCWCGRTLCLDSARRVEGADYCPECNPVGLCPVFICGGCGTVTYDSSAPCGGCDRTDTLRQRRPACASPWELQAEGRKNNSGFEAFALTWVAVFTCGLMVGAPLPLHGVPLSTAWWTILIAACGISGTLASRLAYRHSRYHLFLSAEGIRVQARGKTTDFLNWNEITRLEWTPRDAPRHLILHSGERHIALDTGIKDWETVTAVIRQHSPLVPPPSTKQCKRRTRTPR